MPIVKLSLPALTLYVYYTFVSLVKNTPRIKFRIGAHFVQLHYGIPKRSRMDYSSKTLINMHYFINNINFTFDCVAGTFIGQHKVKSNHQSRSTNGVFCC